MLRDAFTRWTSAADGRGPGAAGGEITPALVSWSTVEVESILASRATGTPRRVTTTSSPRRARSTQWFRQARSSEAETSIRQAYVAGEAERRGEFANRPAVAAIRKPGGAQGESPG